MSMSKEFKTRAMTVVIDSQLERFQIALGMSAKRGGFKGDLGALYARLVMFKRRDSMDFTEWFELTQEASRIFDEWYDWYTRLYVKPNEALFNFSIDEWRKLGGMNGILDVMNGGQS